MLAEQLLGRRRIDFLTAEAQILRDDLLHLRLNLRQILRAKTHTLRELEVVKETVLNHRPDGVLQRGPVKPAQRLGQHMRGAVAHDVQAIGIFFRDDGHLMLTGERMGEVDEFAIDPAHDRSLGQPTADGFGELIHRAAVGKFAYAVVGEGDFCHF